MDRLAKTREKGVQKYERFGKSRRSFAEKFVYLKREAYTCETFESFCLTFARLLKFASSFINTGNREHFDDISIALIQNCEFKLTRES